MKKPRFNSVTAFIAMLGLQAMATKRGSNNNESEETKSSFAYGGLGAFTGAPIYSPKRTKFKGYMRSKQYKAKRT